MVKEDYCSYEVAKLLKEKGFNEKCRGGYHYEFDDNDNPIVMLEEWTAQPYNNDFVDEGFLCSAPTHQMAMKWLREVHNKHCDIGYDIDLKWFFQIIDLKETVEYDYPEPKYYHAENETGFNTYEEAVEAALKYSLENLI